MTGPRDWDKELARIDKAIERMPAGGPPAAPVPAPAAPAAPARRAEAPPPARTARPATAWWRVLLVVALAVAMPFWPYEHRCGINLFLYLAAASMLAVAGVWGSVRSWHTRTATAHVISLLAMLWGLALVAGVVLPRVGYAAAHLAWTCP